VARLGRDVAVNVVANLIAAAIIYLAAVAAGYLQPRKVPIVIISLLVVLAAFNLTLTLLPHEKVNQRLDRIVGRVSAYLTMAVMVLLVVLAFIAKYVHPVDLSWIKF